MSARAYLLMAGFVVLTACAGLFLNYRLMAIYNGSLADNQLWAQRLHECGVLAARAEEIAAPAADLFGGRDGRIAGTRMLAAIERFDEALAGVQAGLRAAPGLAADADLRAVLSRLEQVRAVQEDMSAAAGQTFAAFRFPERLHAGEKAAQMHGKLAALYHVLESLRAEIHGIQARHLRAEQARAAAQVKFQYLIAGLIFVMVGVVVAYGRRVAREARERREERERHMLAMEERNRDMRLVLDHVDQGLLTLNPDGSPARERSAAADRLLGEIPAGTPLWVHLAARSPAGALHLQLGWEALSENPLLAELLLDQLPRRLVLDERHISLHYQPIEDTAGPTRPPRVLVVVSDITAEVERERVAVEQRDLLRMVERLMASRAVFLEFMADTARLVQAVTAPEAARDPSALRRALHTLKGNSGSFGLTGLCGLCHDIESRMAEAPGGVTAAEAEALRAQWLHVEETVERIIGRRGARRIEISPEEHAAVLHGVLLGAPRADLARMIGAFGKQPVQDRLDLLGEQARALGQRLGKEVAVLSDGGGARVDGEGWAGFFSALSHVVRNAVDHGLEDPEERAARGKPPAGHIDLLAESDGEELTVTVADDGRGIRWEQVAARAAALGLPCTRQEDLVDALFAEGLSTRDVVSEISGRGVGMGAVREACARLSGSVEVTSECGHGARFSFRFPVPLTM